MTTKQSASDIGFTRCAVCKIDLKGRFVYLDERIESLLGYTKEELFGKSFLDFVDEKSHKIIEQLLAQRNHYETFFDSTDITVLNGAGEAVDMRVVVSLNFIAGNPVNYQLIIDCDPVAASVEAEATLTNGQRSLFEDFLQADTWTDWKKVLKLICRFTRAGKACLYLVEQDTLQPRTGVSLDVTGEFEFDKIPPAESIHEDVARSGSEYCFTNSDDVSNAVQSYGSAPNEFVCCFDTPAGSRYLARVVFPDDIDAGKAQSAADHSRAILRMAASMMTDEAGQPQSEGNLCDIKFTVGFLDSLAVAAFLTDSKGDVVGYNPSALRIFEEDRLEGSYLETLKSLSQFNQPEFTEPVINYLNSSPLDENFVDQLALRVKTSLNDSARLTVLKLGDDSFDLSSCFVFMPDSADSRQSASSSESPDWQAVLTRIRRDLKHSETLASEFSHEYYNQLGDKGNKSIADLSANIRRIRKLVGSLYRYARLSISGERAGLSDLSLIVDETVAKLEADYPDKKITCTHEQLPKIKTRSGLLARAIYSIMENSLCHVADDLVKIRVTAEQSQNLCTLTFSDKGSGISAKDLPKVFDLLYTGSDRKVGRLGMGLCISRRIIELLGGNIDITSSESGTSVRITLPIE